MLMHVTTHETKTNIVKVLIIHPHHNVKAFGDAPTSFQGTCQKAANESPTHYEQIKREIKKI